MLTIMLKPDPTSSTPHSRVEVAAGLVFRQRQLLVTQRYAHAHLGGLWEFPGGKREANESYEQCLHRELAEELAVAVTILEEVAFIEHRYPEKIVALKFFRCAWKAGEPQALGCPAFRWISLPQLLDFSFPPADEQLLVTLRDRLDWWR